MSQCWVVGERQGSLRELIDRYKFDRAKEAAEVIAGLLDVRLPQLPSDTVVTYIPDIPAHRRQRGYDHMRLIAKTLASKRHLVLAETLVRRTNTSQRGLSRVDRLQAQRGAFSSSYHGEGPVLLIDDIYTTGATIRAGVDALTRDTGTQVFVTVVARQPLDAHDDT